jgi:signal peptidase I
LSLPPEDEPHTQQDATADGADDASGGVAPDVAGHSESGVGDPPPGSSGAGAAPDPAAVPPADQLPPASRNLWASGPQSDWAPAPEPAAAVGLDAAAHAGSPPAAEHAPGWEPEPPVRRTRLQRFRAWRFAPFFEVVLTIAIALGLAESVQAAIVKPFVIPTGSMEPTLEPSQRVLVNRLAYDFGSPHRGDIVVFHPPSSLNCADAKLPENEPCPKSVSTPSSQYFVKRIMGLPGDHLWIENGHPVINGHKITNEPYISPCGNVPACNMPIVITVPKGEYYMLGDNRGDSDDSRYWGPVPSSWIIGEVFATYWPPDRIGIF